MKRLLLFIYPLFLSLTLFAQSREAEEAALAHFKAFYNNNQNDSIYEMLSGQAKSMMSPEQTAQVFTGFHLQLGDLKSFEYSSSKDGMNMYKASFDKSVLGTLISLDAGGKLETFRFLPWQEKKEEQTKKAPSNLVLKTPTGNIYGTMTKPEGGAAMPVVLIVPGSGPTDRDGNNPVGITAASYRMLSDSLVSHGIAVARYDKRGIGESTPAGINEAKMTFEDMIKDVEGLVRMLKTDNPRSKIFVLGHSEGSLIGMIAAGREKVSGFISVSGIADPADKILYKQIAAQSEDLAAKARKIMDSIKKGYTATEIDPLLEGIFRASVQPYIRSWFKYDPEAEIKKLKVPILIIQGTTDIQVGTEEANKLKKAAPTASLKIINGMNHVLKQASSDRTQNIATYSDPSLPLDPSLVSDIVKFVH